ncbi:MAG: hypothetical protein JWO92_2506 [Chitinophagaceae bacterium]|nr:hypothetical protein [Chitinophagaceae bacterium]
MVPVIENIHQKVLEAVSTPKAFDMSAFHKCETTHCWAGWVIHIAGEKGYELERQTSSVFAAMQILDKSSPIKVSPTRFFEDNETAMSNIEKCAEQEKAIDTI